MVLKIKNKRSKEDKYSQKKVYLEEVDEIVSSFLNKKNKNKIGLKGQYTVELLSPKKIKKQELNTFKLKITYYSISGENFFKTKYLFTKPEYVKTILYIDSEKYDEDGYYLSLSEFRRIFGNIYSKLQSSIYCFNKTVELNYLISKNYEVNKEDGNTFYKKTSKTIKNKVRNYKKTCKQLYKFLLKTEKYKE